MNRLAGLLEEDRLAPKMAQTDMALTDLAEQWLKPEQENLVPTKTNRLAGLLEPEKPTDFAALTDRQISEFGKGFAEEPISKLGPIGAAIDTAELFRIKRYTDFISNPETDWEAVAEEQRRSFDNQYNRPGIIGYPMSRQEYLAKRKEITADKVKQNIQKEVESFGKILESRSEGGIARNVGRITSAMPAWMLDFYLTGPMAKGTSTPVKRAI